MLIGAICDRVSGFVEHDVIKTMCRNNSHTN